MGKGKKRRRKKPRGSREKAPPPASGPAAAIPAGARSKRSSLPFLLGGALLSLAVLVGGLVWLRPEPVPVLPEVDLADMEPQVSRKIDERRQAVLDAPDSAEAWGELGVALQAHGLESEAAACYQEAVARDPEEFRWQYLLVHALRDQDRGAALREAERASVLRPDYAPTYIFRAELLEEDGELDRAAELYRKSLSLVETNALAHFGLGRILLSRGELEASLEHLLRAKELSPEAGAVRASLAQVYRRRGDREQAMNEARSASALRDPVGIADPVHFAMRQESVSSIAQLDRAIAAADAGDHGEAERILQELVELRPDDADLHGRLGDALAQQRKLVEAKEAYRKALSIQAEHPAALFGLANVLNLEGAHEPAEEYYRRSLAVRPEHVPTLVNLGSLSAFRGELDEAAKFFEQGLEIEPEDFACHRQLGQLRLRQGKLAEGISHLRSAVEKRPEVGPVHATLAAALAQSGDWVGARLEAEQARALGATLPEKLMEAIRAH